jgi:hypothetical protein
VRRQVVKSLTTRGRLIASTSSIKRPGRLDGLDQPSRAEEAFRWRLSALAGPGRRAGPGAAGLHNSWMLGMSSMDGLDDGGLCHPYHHSRLHADQRVGCLTENMYQGEVEHLLLFRGSLSSHLCLHHLTACITLLFCPCSTILPDSLLMRNRACLR